MKTAILILAILFSLAVVSPVSAQPGYAPPPGYQQPMPGQVLRDGISKLLVFIQSGGVRDRAATELFVEREIAPHFDFSYMTQWVAGPRFRYMDNRQRNELETRLRQEFLSSMLNQLASYDVSRVRYLRPRGNPASGEIDIGIMSYPRQGYPTRINFRMYLSDNGWKVFDVALNGQSALMYYRNYFARQMPPQPGAYPPPRGY